MPRYIAENDVYNLFDARGVAQLHVGDIDLLSRAEVKEVVHGRWIKKAAYNDGVLNTVACSACDTFQPVWSWDYYNYCPHCGAKMNERS